jgi:hypothetical protein
MLRFRARDDSGQVVGEDRKVFVENSARLTVVDEVRGEIVDLDARRILVVDAAESGDQLGIYDRTSRITEAIPLPDSLEVNRAAAYLTPSGAIFVGAPLGGTSLDATVYSWQGGSLIGLGHSDSTTSLQVSGRHAIWNDGTNLYRHDTVTGISSLVSTVAGNWKNSVAGDGTIAFWTAGYQIVRDIAGQQTQLTSGTNQLHTWPVTDGQNVVYRLSDPYPSKQNGIVLITSGGSVVLAEKREWDPAPESGDDYQANGGWVAYTDLGVQLQRHVFTRSPLGSVTRHTDFAANSDIEELAENGELMLINDGSRYFSRGTGTLAVSSSAGRSYWLSGAWYLAIGRAVLAVDTQN